MRWSLPKDGAVRIIKLFALFPIGIDCEYRWLETCYIKQKYSYILSLWYNEEFSTKEEAERYAKRDAC